MIVPESFHAASDDVPCAGNWAGDPGIRLKPLPTIATGGSMAYRRIAA